MIILKITVVTAIVVGVFTYLHGHFYHYMGVCPRCEGKGFINGSICPDCNGDGKDHHI